MNTSLIDVLRILLVQHGFKNLKILQIMYELISTSATQKCVVFERQYPLEYYTQRAKYITRYLKVFTS